MNLVNTYEKIFETGWKKKVVHYLRKKLMMKFQIGLIR